MSFGRDFEVNLSVAVQEIVEQTVTGLGYDLVEIERSAGGMLRITIDLPWTKPGAVAGAGAMSGNMCGVMANDSGAMRDLTPEQFVNVEDCEKVTRQLVFALEVDGVEYKRLEVSSPGIDRPLRHEKDFERFIGHVIDVSLKAPIGAAAAGQVNATRKKFRGTLERVQGTNEVAAVNSAADGSEVGGSEAGGSAEVGGIAMGGSGASSWQIVWSDAPAVKPGQRVSKKRPPAPLQALGFKLDELREARLAPIVSFKGRGVKDDTPATNG